MKALTFTGFAIMLAAFVWLAVNQQRMSRELRALALENQRLQAANRSLAASLANPATPQATRSFGNTPMPVKPLTPPVNTGPRRYRPAGITPADDLQNGLITESRSGQLSSHSPDGKLLSRPWGPEQVVGPPNTTQAGDQSTAWAQYTSSGGDGEWLHVTFEKTVDMAEVIVRETYNPGAISKVTAVLPNGQETTIWEGTEPGVQAPVDMSFPVTQKVEAKAVKVYLDRRRVPGWNEIDAVELVGRDGSRQWAASATVSSAYSISPGTTTRTLQNGALELETLRGVVEEGDVIRR